MSYTILDSAAVVSYVWKTEPLKKMLEVSSLDDLSAKEIGNGNLNSVFLVSVKHDPSVQLILTSPSPIYVV